MGVMNHHRTGEVFVEVIYIFTHSGTKWKKNQTGADRNVLIGVQSRASSGDKKQILFVPAAEASRHTDVVEQNQMLDKLAEADSSSMRTDGHWGERRVQAAIFS